MDNVDDGSTDSTADRVMSIVEKDGRFNYYYQQQTGQHKARMVALLRAKGSFVTFTDGDDYLDVHHLEKMINMTDENVNLVISGYFETYKRNKIGRPPLAGAIDNQVLSMSEFVNSWISGDVQGFLFNKLFDINLFDGIDIENDYPFMEDTRLISKICTSKQLYVAVQPEPTYFYVQRPKSSVRKTPNSKEYAALADTIDSIVMLACSDEDKVKVQRHSAKLFLYELSKESLKSLMINQESITLLEDKIKQMSRISGIESLNFVENIVLFSEFGRFSNLLAIMILNTAKRFRNFCRKSGLIRY